jgi:hypothetical protein
MSGFKKLAGAYLVLVAIVVAVYFIINNFLLDTIDVPAVWLALHVLMLIGLAIGLIYNYGRKRAMDGGGAGDGVTRGYFEANATFFVTAGVAILFLHNWFALLAHGSNYLGDNHQSWIIWAVVNTMLPIILGITGCHMWKNADG